MKMRGISLLLLGAAAFAFCSCSYRRQVIRDCMDEGHSKEMCKMAGEDLLRSRGKSR